MSQGEAAKALREARSKSQKKLNELLYKAKQIERDIQEERNRIAELEEALEKAEG